MKKILLFFTLWIPHLAVFSQTFRYDYVYDDSGNRIQRTVIQISGLKSSSAFDTENECIKDRINLTESFEEDISGFKIILYPNPTHGELIVQISPLPSGISGSITLITPEGKIISSDTQLSEYNLVDLTGEVPGNYILRLKILNEQRIYKLIKQ